MQVSSTSNLTWLQSASAAAGQTSPAGSTAGQDLLDASGAEGGPPSSMLASLQSPSQLFSSANLGALISAQASQSTTDPILTSGGAAQDANSSASDGPAQSPPTGGPIPPHRHHHHGGGGGGSGRSAAQVSDTGSVPTTSTAATTAGSTAEDVQAPLSQLLASFV